MTWDQAYAEISHKLKLIIAEHGPGSVFSADNPRPVKFYTDRFMAALGSPNVFSHPTTCHAARTLAFGLTVGTVPTADYAEARYMVFIGRSPAEGVVPFTLVELGRARANVLIAGTLYDTEWVKEHGAGFREGGLILTPSPPLGSLDPEQYPAPLKVTLPRADGAGLAGQFPVATASFGIPQRIPELIDQGALHAGFIYNYNPARTLTDPQRVAEALRRLAEAGFDPVPVWHPPATTVPPDDPAAFRLLRGHQAVHTQSATDNSAYLMGVTHRGGLERVWINAGRAANWTLPTATGS